MNSVISFENVSRVFDNKILLDKISFSISQGTLTTLIGPNGAGKTTIAKLILRLEQPSSGTINISPKLKIDYVPQKLNLDKNLPLTSKDFYHLLSSPTKSKTNKTLIDKILEFADFGNIKNKEVSQLSNGQFQKLLIATILSKEPDFLVLDEPTQSLDINSQQNFYSLIDELRRNTGITIFMISHDLHIVMKNSDQVICLNGHVCCSGKPSDLSEDQLFLDSLSRIGFYNHHHDHKH